MKVPSVPPKVEDIVRRKADSLSGDHVVRPEFLEFLRRCDLRYWTWDELRFHAPKTIDREVAWALTKSIRGIRRRVLKLTGHSDAPVHFNLSDGLQRDLMLVDQQLAGRLASDDEMPLTNRQGQRFIINSLQEEAIASSMLEGAVTTRDDAKKMLRNRRTPRTHGERMVLNNYRAMEYVSEHAGSPLTPEFLLQVHHIVTTGTIEDSQVGRFRTDHDDVKVVDERDNEIVHAPPPASELGKRMVRLCQFANEEMSDATFIHPIVRGCALHFQIGFDHPFCDGNGRTARAIFYWSMLRAGYWLFKFLPISRLIRRGPAKYVRAFLNCEVDEFDLTYFLLYKAKIISRAREELRTYIHGQQESRSMWRKFVGRDSRLNHRQAQVAMKAAEDPHRVFTMAGQRTEFAVSYATARSDLRKLAEWGYLVQEKIGKEFVYRAAADIARISP